MMQEHAELLDEVHALHPLVWLESGNNQPLRHGPYLCSCSERETL